MIAVFDFDGTLCYGPTGIFLFASHPLWKSFPCIAGFALAQFFHLQGRVEHRCIRGLDMNRAVRRAVKIPPVPAGVELFRELEKDHRMIVMSYSFADVVRAYLKKLGLEAEVYAKEVVKENGRAVRFSDDPVTEALLDDPVHGKRKVLQLAGLKPDICVGDNERRDRLCDNFVDIRKVEPDYVNKVIQAVRTFSTR